MRSIRGTLFTIEPEVFSMFDKSHPSPRTRAEGFAHRLGIRLPILLAPMAGACPPSLSIAVANAGGLEACYRKQIQGQRRAIRGTRSPRTNGFGRAILADARELIRSRFFPRRWEKERFI